MTARIATTAFLLLALLSGCAQPPVATALAQPVPATPTPGTTIRLSPSPRGFHFSATDGSGNALVFGGQSAMNVGHSDLTDVWTFDGGDWSQKGPATAGQSLDTGAYTEADDRIVIFVGWHWDPKPGDVHNSFTMISETWAYDPGNDTWRNMAPDPTSMPGGRIGGRISYDSESDKFILFGGLQAPDLRLLADTWAYDFTTNTWIDMSPTGATPPGRNFHGQYYDPVSDRVIVFGSLTAREVLENDTWAYDYNSNKWTELGPANSPAPRDFPTMVYAGQGHGLLFGGATANGTPISDPWIYDAASNTWSQATFDNQPSPRVHHSMTYDAARQVIILFGGYVTSQLTPSDETWTFDTLGRAWSPGP